MIVDLSHMIFKYQQKCPKSGQMTMAFHILFTKNVCDKLMYHQI